MHGSEVERTRRQTGNILLTVTADSSTCTGSPVNLFFTRSVICVNLSTCSEHCGGRPRSRSSHRLSTDSERYLASSGHLHGSHVSNKSHHSLAIYMFRSQVCHVLVSVDFLQRDPTRLNMTLYRESRGREDSRCLPRPSHRTRFLASLMHPWPSTWLSRSRRTLTLLSSTSQLFVSLKRTSRNGDRARRPSRLGSTCVVTVRPHVQETQRRLFLKLPDNTRRFHAEWNSTLQGHRRCLIWRLHGAISFDANANSGRSCNRYASLIAADL